MGCDAGPSDPAHYGHDFPDECDVVSDLHGLDGLAMRATCTNNPRTANTDVMQRFMVVSQNAGHIVSSYKPLFFVLVHFHVFPWGTGTCPKGMSKAAWAKVLMERWPREQFAQQPLFIHDANNIWQRETVGMESFVQFKLTPSQAQAVADAPLHVVQGVVNIVSERKQGSALQKRLDALGPLGRVLFNAYKQCGARVPGEAKASCMHGGLQQDCTVLLHISL